MEWEEISNETAIQPYAVQEAPSTSNALAQQEKESGARSLVPENSANVFGKVRVKGAKNVEIGATHHHYHKNITQVIHQPNPSVAQSITESQNENSNTITDDFLLQNVPYLRSLYSTENAYMSSLLWEDDEHDCSLKDYFIDLKLDEADLLGFFKKRQDIPLESIFLPDKGQRSPERILITGDPGYGKSTVCSKLAYDWAMLEPPHYLSHFDVLVIVPLHNLGKRILEEVVIDVLADEETDIEKLKKFLHKSKYKFLIILDGLDEATDITNIEKSLKPNKNPVRFPKDTTILLTSRSHAAKPIRKLFHRHLYVNGFTKEKQKEYIEMFFYNDNQAQMSIDKILLSEESTLDEFAHCPLMLHMMCCLHEEINLSSLKRITDMYIQVFNLFFTRYESKYGCHPLLQVGKFVKGEHLLLKLGKMCFDIISGKLAEITEKELISILNQDEYDMLLKVGLLKTSKSYSRRKVVSSFEILHRVFVECLAAFFFYYEIHTSQCVNHDMIEELLQYHFCENFLICLAGFLKEKFHLVITGNEDDKFYEWDIGVCSKLLKEAGHSRENMEACKQWLQCIDINTSLYYHSDVDAALPLALWSKNSLTERISFQFFPLYEYVTGQYYVITPKLLHAMKNCPTLRYVEIFIQFEVLEKHDDLIGLIDLIACFPFLSKLLQIKKEIMISVVLYNDDNFDPHLYGEFIEENGSYKRLLMEEVNQGHELLEDENFIICLDQPGGTKVRFIIFPEGGLPPKLALGIYRPDYYDFTESSMFKYILEVLKSKDIGFEIFLSEPEDMNAFDTKAYPVEK